MALPPEDLERLRELGRERRRLRAADRRRAELGSLGIIDTGLLTDDDVMQALAAYRAGRDEGVNGDADIQGNPV